MISFFVTNPGSKIHVSDQSRNLLVMTLVTMMLINILKIILPEEIVSKLAVV